MVKDVSQFFKVLADEARLKILWLLFNQRELCVCDIMEALGITQSKASRHLATLRHAGLVVDRKEGLWSYYTICPIDDDLARDQLAVLWNNLAKRPDTAQLLKKLRAWLEAKNRSAVCNKGIACAAAKKKAVMRASAPFSGGNR
jgi:ArsR family transcriptional regulator